MNANKSEDLREFGESRKDFMERVKEHERIRKTARAVYGDWWIRFDNIMNDREGR
jgi:hypothetical protein